MASSDGSLIYPRWKLIEKNDPDARRAAEFAVKSQGPHLVLESVETGQLIYGFTDGKKIYNLLILARGEKMFPTFYGTAVSEDPSHGSMTVLYFVRLS